ncbi:MAG TPA: endonuclease/exonuclease/phosphatase family protein [Myxococcota bacterium]|nr:endonuclease/exonuclease/phosphatase family protein [Myxococcota bacterium]
MRSLARLKFWAGFSLPLLAMLCSGGIAALLSEDALWWSAARSVLLTLPRWLVLAWVPWALYWAWRDRRKVYVAWAVFALLAAGVPPLGPDDEEALLVVVANVQAYSEADRPLEDALGELNADVVVTVEKRGERVPGMQRVADNYDRDLPRDSHGSAVFCRKELFCQGEITEEFGDLPGCGMPIALVRVEAAICIVGMHAPPPLPTCSEGISPYVSEVVEHVDEGRIAGDWGPCVDQDPVLVMGDMNYVPGSRVHRSLTDTGLVDETRWFGIWGSTWPAGGGWPNAPFFRLDQVLAGEVDISAIRYLRLPEADHRAVRARVKLN